MPKAKGSTAYTKRELSFLFHYIEKYYPFGANHWDKVTAKYNDRAVKHGHKERRAKNLKDKFDALCKVKKPTGDPTCPPEVKRAKRLLRDILAANEIRTTDDSAGVDDDDGDNTTDDEDVDVAAVDDGDDGAESSESGFDVSDSDNEGDLEAAFGASSSAVPVVDGDGLDGTGGQATLPDVSPPPVPHEGVAADATAAAGKKRTRSIEPAAGVAGAVAPAPTPVKIKRARTGAGAGTVATASPVAGGGGRERLFSALTSAVQLIAAAPMESAPSQTASDNMVSHQVTQLAVQVASLGAQMAQLHAQMGSLERQLSRSASREAPTNHNQAQLAHLSPSQELSPPASFFASGFPAAFP